MNSDTSPNKVGEFFSECSLPFNEHFSANRYLGFVVRMLEFYVDDPGLNLVEVYGFLCKMLLLKDEKLKEAVCIISESKMLRKIRFITRASKTDGNFFENFAVDPKSISKSEPTSELRSFDRPHSGNLVTQSQFLVQN